MKKYILSLLLFLVSITLNAQIQRTFFGCTFGSTKAVVAQKMKALGYNIHYTDEGFMAEQKISHNVKFGGYTWSFVDFKFYKNSFYNICFCNSSYTYQSKKMSLISYRELRNKLNKKYSQCYKNDWGVADIGWTDSKTGLICRYLYVNDADEIVYQDSYDKHLNLYLWYYDKNTMKFIKKSEDNDL